MPDTTETTDVVDTTATTEIPEETQSQGDTTDPEESTEVLGEPESQSKREARYRVQLRETEAERDTLAARVEALQRAEAERLAGEVIANPAALWAAETALPDLLADDGTIDPKKVEDAARAARENLGLKPPVRGPVVPKEGTSLHKTSSTNTWADAFKA